MYAFPSLVTALTLLVYLILTINVGRARSQYKIAPPATTGDENFERVLRVQQNTLEQLIFFLPLLWLFSYYVNPLWGAGIGTIWLIGRIIYAWGYYQAAEKRGIGFAISSLSSMTLLLGALIGISLSLINLQF
jgi:glutathione S-transferase